MKKININETELRSLVRESIYNVLGNDKEEINNEFEKQKQEKFNEMIRTIEERISNLK